MRIEVHPVFSLVIHLDHLYNVDLTHRGFYQLRFRLKPSVPCATDICYDRTSSPNGIYPSCVFEDCAVSKTVEVVFAEESVCIDDVFRCSFRVPQRFETLDCLSVHMAMELFFLDRDRPPRMESFTMISRRTVHINMRLDSSLHVHRPLFFEYFAFSAVTVTIHGSLVALLCTRKRLPPDPPVNDKLRDYHMLMCRAALSTQRSMQNFISRHSDILSSPLDIDVIDLETECDSYVRELNSSANGWASLELTAARLSSALTQLFAQLHQMFAHSAQLSAALNAEFDLARMKRLGEGFVYSEDTVQSLISSELPQNASRIADLIKKAPYYSRMPETSVHCEGNDVNPTNITVVVERRYLPAGVSRQPSVETPREAPPEVDVCEVESPHSPVSSSRLHPLIAGLCLPLNCTHPEEPYVLNPPSDGAFLAVTADRLNCRRMTDPGTLLTISTKESAPLLAPPSPRGKKSKSISDMVITLASFAQGSTASSPQEGPVDDGSTMNGGSPSSHTSHMLNCGIPATNNSTHATQQVLRADSSGASPSSDRYAPMVSLDERLVQFIHRKESFKQKLQSAGYHVNLYSDLAYFPHRQPYFSNVDSSRRASPSEAHLIIFVHGLEGGSEDLAPYRNFLRLLLPNANLRFLLSEANQLETWTDLNQLAENLLNEILAYLEACVTPPKRISFVAHSMGGVIVRCALGLPKAAPLVPLLHTLLTLNAPHCGLMYNQRAAHWGIALVQWWKQSASLEQLCLRDAMSLRDTFLYRLSTNGALAKFKYVLLVGAFQDLYVPHHSAIIEYCKGARRDPSVQGTIYEEMVANLHECVASSARHTTLVKYTVFHSLANVSRAHQVTGRAAHIAVVDDDLFIEKLLAVSAVKYFQ